MILREEIRHRRLRALWEKGEERGLDPRMLPRIKRVLNALDVANDVDEISLLPGYRMHRLKGDLAGRYAVSVSANWRITFGWRNGVATAVDLEDYHGR